MKEHTKPPQKDVEGEGNKKLPEGAKKGPDRPTKPTFKTGQSG